MVTISLSTSPQTDFILSFSQETTLALVGGKGANLAELARGGFTVPPGFIITTNAYRRFVEANKIQSRILTRAKNVSSDDPAALESASAEIRALFERGTLPIEIAEAMIAAYHLLSNHPPTELPVAVRSSATAEDLPGLAFAGQQDTYLNIVGSVAVLQAVKKCWGSLWTARAIAYRSRNNIPTDDVALAVVVQKMIASESSGVLFTANPVTGRRDEIVIDASFGLGEAIVSGQVDPDHYVVNPHPWQIVERKLGAKQIAIIPRVNGGTEQIKRDDSPQQALPDTQIIALAQTAQRAAEHFGSPQDIEWAWANQQMYILQSRPITSLYPLPKNAEHADGLRVYINFNSIQGVTDPLTPLGIDALRLLFSGIRQILQIHSSMNEILPDAGNRLFIDMTDLVCDPRLQNFVLGFLASSDPGAQQIVFRLIQEKRFAPKRVLAPRRIIILIAAALPILRRIIAAMIAPDDVYRHAIATAEEFTSQVHAHAQAALDLKERLHAMENDLSRAEEISFAIMPTVLPVFAVLPMLDRWLVEWLGEKPGTALQLMRGLPNNVTTEMDLKLWALAQMIRADRAACDEMTSQPIETLVQKYRQGKLPMIAQRALEQFLQAYGMRAVAEIDLGRARWRDDPTPILQTLRAYLQIENANIAPDAVYAHNKRNAEQLAADLIARARKTRFGWLRARLISGIVRRMRALSGLREVPLFYMVKTLGIYRTVLLDSGRGLVARSELDRAEDIFFVPLDSLSSGRHSLKDIVAANRADYERERRRKQMPRVLLSNGEAFYEGMSDSNISANDLVGEAVSPGVAEGRAHVILDPHNVHLEPGEILVCPSTDPGWTPLFLAASGLVMEIGGMITHGSVVAREYGIPAVVGVHKATTRIKTGDHVRVDGNRGIISIVE